MVTSFSETQRERFLADKRIAVLSVTAEPGRPPVAFPVWYDYQPGGDIRLTTASARRKARLIREHGKVTILVQREEPPYQYVIVEGTVIGDVVPGPIDERAAIAARYLGSEAGAAFARDMPSEGQVVFTIRPDHWSSADFSDM